MHVDSFAALKRAIRPGTRIKCLSHWRDAARPDLAPEAGTVRAVTKAQGNGYFFERDGKRLWADYPARAADIAFSGDTFTICYGKKGPQSDFDRVATFQIVE